jgi:hypothetical protein
MPQESFYDDSTDTFRLTVKEEIQSPCFTSDYLQARISAIASLIVPSGTPVKIEIKYNLDVRPVKVYGYSISNWPGNMDFVIASLSRGGTVVAEHRLSQKELSGGDRKNGQISMELNSLEPDFYEFSVKAFCRNTVKAEVCSTTLGIPVCCSETATRQAYAQIDVFLNADHVYDFSLTGEKGWQSRIYPIQVQ